MKHTGKISANLDENLDYYRETFKNDQTIKVRMLNPYDFPALRAGIIFVDGLVNDLIINQNIIAPILNFNNMSSLTKTAASSEKITGGKLFNILK